MGQRVEFPSNAHTCQGYFAAPQIGKGPAVVLIQEYWGLVPHIEDLVNRFAKEGFAAVARDLYHGKITKSPDEAGKMLMELDADRAAAAISRSSTTRAKRCTSLTLQRMRGSGRSLSSART
jgi:carboxymethylenebutenolidase